ncbi:MAG: DUF1987 domain-containing protein [Thermodesulfobacteriota bacterium]
MDILKLEATKYTPDICFDPDRQLLSIRGESYPENTMEFYAPVFECLKDYLALPDDPPLTVDVELIYFNSSSSKTLINLFDLLDGAAREGRTITINWIYETDDEDNLEFGEEFAEDLEHVRFNLVEKDAER